MIDRLFGNNQPNAVSASIRQFVFATMAFRWQTTLIILLLGMSITDGKNLQQKPLLFQSSSLEDFRDSLVQLLPVKAQHSDEIFREFIPKENQERAIVSRAPQQFFHFQTHEPIIESSTISKLKAKGADEKSDNYHSEKVNQQESKHNDNYHGGKVKQKENKQNDNYHSEKVKQKENKHNQNHHREHSLKGETEKKNRVKSYGENGGHHHENKDEGGHGGEHHSEKAEGHHGKSQNSGHRAKGNFEKGFHDIYHKDEHKNHDSFFSNNHEEGKSIHFGSGYRKYGKKGGGKKDGAFANSDKQEKGSGKSGKKAHGSNHKEDKKYASQGGSESAHQHEHKFAKEHSQDHGKKFVSKNQN